MKLSSQQLEAFTQVAKTLNFTKAANDLCITQSALSQRIQKLERHIGSTLFLRGIGGIKLTNTGEQLLRYCTIQTALEQEFLIHKVLGNDQQLVGEVRIAGFSTVMESLVLPELAPLLQNHPLLHLELHSMELRELLPALESGLVDFIVFNNKIHRPAIECTLIGYEHNVLIQATSQTSPDDVFLDHDKEDTTTATFWQQQQNAPKSWRTHYLDNIHLIISGVKLGLGKAVVPLHLVKEDQAIRVCHDYAPLKTPIYLARHKNELQTRLQDQLWQVIQLIKNNLGARDPNHLRL